MRRWLVLVLISLLGQACGLPGDRLRVGAVYPVGGTLGPEAIDEYRGVLLAADLVNSAGGVAGRQIEVVLEEASSPEAAPGAVRRLADRGIRIVLGSYGSTISRPAAAAAARRGLVFWETGAVGQMGSDALPGQRFFRMVTTGTSLGRAGVDFVRRQLLPLVGANDAPRYAVAYVDDVYGRSVGLGAVREITSAGDTLAGRFPYELSTVDYEDLARRIDAADTDVLVVAAYLEDGIELRRAVLRRGMDLAASIGTSSSYCMPDFGLVLGEDAVGLFASDKPEADFLRPEMLSPEAGRQLVWAREEYQRRHGARMSAPALSGFASAIALFQHVLPRAGSDRPEDVVGAAHATSLPMGSLPNGAGLQFAPPGHPEAGANLRAASVIWEWVRPNVREVVWPPSLATSPIVPIRP